MRKTRHYFIIISLVILLLLFTFVVVFVLPFVGLLPNYSNGERTGEIFKFSQKGIFWKSWEGTMYLGGVSRSSEGGLVLEKFNFSIPKKEWGERPEVIEKLKKCGQTRAICTVEYGQWFISPANVDSNYIVKDVLTTH